jgi:hypothetical protein
MLIYSCVDLCCIYWSCFTVDVLVFDARYNTLRWLMCRRVGVLTCPWAIFWFVDNIVLMCWRGSLCWCVRDRCSWGAVDVVERSERKIWDSGCKPSEILKMPEIWMQNWRGDFHTSRCGWVGGSVDGADQSSLTSPYGGVAERPECEKRIRSLATTEPGTRSRQHEASRKFDRRR